MLGFVSFGCELSIASKSPPQLQTGPCVDGVSTLHGYLRQECFYGQCEPAFYRLTVVLVDSGVSTALSLVFCPATVP